MVTDGVGFRPFREIIHNDWDVLVTISGIRLFPSDIDFHIPLVEVLLVEVAFHENAVHNLHNIPAPF